jgi:hypothetical protein
VLALRARGGAANDGRAMGSFIDECVAAVPTGARGRYGLWIRLDSAGYQDQALAAAERHQADFSVTARQYAPVAAVVHALAADPATVWTPALGRETEQGSEIAATTTTLLGRTVRLIVRRQPKAAGDQVAIDDSEHWAGGCTPSSPTSARRGLSAAAVEAHHRLRGGIPARTPSGR